jgi:hypothetical protein
LGERAARLESDDLFAMILQPKTLQGAPALQPITLRTGPGVRHSTRAGKCVVEAGRRPRSKGASPHPFQVFLRAKPSNAAITQAGVYYHSSLFQSLRPNDKYPITGLLSEDKSTGWFDLIANDAIWLGVTFDSSGEPDWAGIDSWGGDKEFKIDKEAWSNEKAYCEDDGGTPPIHQTSRKLIAYTTANDEGKPVLHQVMFRHQVLRDCNIDGRPARYPFDHEGGYPL